uniref:GOLD domain-containing protein n=1 Tax=Syphacia muris TaxID=451379 RepID=A0A0N5AJ75_9BILA
MSRTFYTNIVTSTDGQEIVFFVAAQSSPSARVSITAASSGEVWIKNYTSKEWEELLKEEEINSTSELFRNLSSNDTITSVEFTDDALKLTWSAVDEDGLYEEIFASELLLQKDVGIFNVLKEVLLTTETFHSRAFSAEDQLEIVNSKLDTTIELVKDLQEKKNNLERDLIKKFAAIMNNEAVEDC